MSDKKIQLTTFDCPGLGDKIQFTSLPENYYKNTGQKLYVNPAQEELFIYNPYVLHGTSNQILNIWDISHKFQPNIFGQAAACCEFFKMKCFCRHPRLYKHEELDVSSEFITLHTTGKSFGSLSDEVLSFILERYKGKVIFQIGGKNDKFIDSPAIIDKRGLDIYDSACFIAKSHIFIGVNSSMMNVAKCYPRVNKKIIISENENNFPAVIPNKTSNWLDYNMMYFNEKEHDLGISMTYRKL